MHAPKKIRIQGINHFKQDFVVGKIIFYLHKIYKPNSFLHFRDFESKIHIQITKNRCSRLSSG